MEDKPGCWDGWAVNQAATAAKTNKCEAEGLVLSSDLQAYADNVIVIILPKVVNG